MEDDHVGVLEAPRALAVVAVGVVGHLPLAGLAVGDRVELDLRLRHAGTLLAGLPRAEDSVHAGEPAAAAGEEGRAERREGAADDSRRVVPLTGRG